MVYDSSDIQPGISQTRKTALYAALYNLQKGTSNDNESDDIVAC